MTAAEEAPMSRLDSRTVRAIRGWRSPRGEARPAGRCASTGTPAHSSQIFRDDIGYGAVYELARDPQCVQEKMAGEAHLTFNPGVMLGGTTVEFDPVQTARLLRSARRTSSPSTRSRPATCARSPASSSTTRGRR